MRLGGALVCVRADNQQEASEAASLMREHGALDIDACRAGWRGREQLQPDPPAEHYAKALGEYPAAPGRIYGDARYSGPELRVANAPYPGVNRRAA